MKKVCWNITSKCNRKCKYCFKFNREDLSLESNLLILDKLIYYKVDKIVSNFDNNEINYIYHEVSGDGCI